MSREMTRGERRLCARFYAVVRSNGKTDRSAHIHFGPTAEVEEADALAEAKRWVTERLTRDVTWWGIYRCPDSTVEPGRLVASGQ